MGPGNGKVGNRIRKSAESSQMKFSVIPRSVHCTQNLLRNLRKPMWNSLKAYKKGEKNSDMSLLVLLNLDLPCRRRVSWGFPWPQSDRTPSPQWAAWSPPAACPPPCSSHTCTAGSPGSPPWYRPKINVKMLQSRSRPFWGQNCREHPSPALCWITGTWLFVLPRFNFTKSVVYRTYSSLQRAESGL